MTSSLTQALVRAARVVGPKHGLGVHAGLNVRRRVLRRVAGLTEQMSGLGLLNIEMEAAGAVHRRPPAGLRAE